MSSNRPLVSIVMPVYNAEKFVDQAIFSVVRQTYKNWELLICDDSSTDNSYKKLVENNYRNKKIRIFKNEQNIGQTLTKNFLIKESEGDFITFLDSDDLFHEERVEKAVNEFNSNRNLALLGCQVGYFIKDLKIIRQSRKPLNYQHLLEIMLHHNPIGGATMFVRKKILEEVGLFRPFFSDISNEDYDLVCRIAEKHESYALKDVLYYYRQHPNSISKKVSLDRLLSNQIVKKLALQRLQSGEDSLMRGEIDELNAFTNELKKPFQKERSLVYQKYSEIFMYNKLYSRAIVISIVGLSKQPLSLKNWLNIQYCFRKYLLDKLGLAS